LGSIPDWTGFFKQAYNALKPGGYLESYEGSPRVYSDDDTLPPTSALSQWTSLFVDGGRKIGRSFDIVEENTQNTAMKEAGFVDIQEKWIKVHFQTSPLGLRDSRVLDLTISPVLSRFPLVAGLEIRSKRKLARSLPMPLTEILRDSFSS